MIPAMLQQCSRDSAAMSFDAVILAFANKIAKALYHPDFSNSLLHRDVYMYLLEALKNAVPLVATQLTQWLLQTPQDGSQPKLFNLEMTCAYLKHNLLHIVDVDKYLAEQVRELAQQHGPSLTHFNMRLEFVINLVRRCVVQQRYVVVTELPFLFGNLSKMTQGHIQSGSKLGDTLIRLLEDVQAAAARSRGDKTKNSDFPGEGDPDELDIEFARQMRAVFAEQIPNETKHRIVRLFEEWMAICSQGSGNDKQYALYLERLQQQRVLATPGSSVTFFRVIVEACVSSAYAHLVDVPQHQEQQQTGALNARQQAISNFLADEAKSQSTGVLRYHAIDALAKFVVFLSKFLDPSGQTPPQQPTNNVNRMILFKWFLTTVVWGILKDHSAQQEQFNQRPYLRLLVNIMQELNSPDPVLDSNNVDVLLILAHCLMLLRPTRIPTFAFAWLELVSHRTFMSKMLLSKNPNCSRALSRLLIDVFRFMRPSLAAADLSSGMRLLYRGTLRIILVLLHDFPEFLCEYHFAFCDVIPSSCVQARNLILSAFPRNMRLPDPFTPNLKVDMLPEIAHAPRISSDVLGALEAHRNQIMHPLEQYLKMIGKGQHVQVSPHIFAALRYTSSGNSLAVAKQIIKAGTVYDVPLINALVLFVGCQAIAKNNANKNPNQQGHDLMSQFRDNACFEFFASLINNLDAEGRYHVLNAIANQLRFPNAHTHYFSCCTLYLFLRAENEVIVEQITRVLVERLMVHRPHPWGLLITFVELIKNRRYELWKRGFHNMAPEIERLFEKVARSCMPGKDGQPPSGQGQGGSGQQQQPPQNL
jgi:CCR4-NOT transcription complex subunit 1